MEKLTEVEVSELWQRTVKDNASLSTVDKQIVQVIYPGRPSDEPGADFKDAVLSIDGRLNKGDIEVHVKSSDWCTHRHHQNKTYNGIILHVVMWHDSQNVTHLENGGCIPMISLDDQRTVTAIRKEILRPSLSCGLDDTSNISVEQVIDILNRAGEVRFREKQSAFRGELEINEAGQYLYRGIMGALGYSRNINPFHKVADKLPLDLLESIVRESSDAVTSARIEALLLGTTGFLPSQKAENLCSTSGDNWINILEKEWQSSGDKLALSLGEWQLFRVRPGNFPPRRSAGMAQLLLKHQKGGLLVGLSKLVEETLQNGNWRRLEDGLMVVAHNYWLDHFAPGKQCQKLDPWLIGRARASEIIINILLPFFAAYSESGGWRRNGTESFRLYCDYPVATINTIVRHMCNQLRLKQSQIKSARCQQGLLHLYKRFCTEGRCGECPLIT
jgi:hypothetical protein